jgi:Ca2+-dependent lipid-binding protein
MVRAKLAIEGKSTFLGIPINSFKVMEAKDLVPASKSGKHSDPYVVITLGQKKKKTKVKRKTTVPKWNEVVVL